MGIMASTNCSGKVFQYCNYGYDKTKYTSQSDCMNKKLMSDCGESTKCPEITTQGSITMVMKQSFQKFLGCPEGTPNELGCSPRSRFYTKGQVVTGFKVCEDGGIWGSSRTYLKVDGVKIPITFLDPIAPNEPIDPIKVNTPDQKKTAIKTIIFSTLFIGIAFYLYKKN